MLTDKEKEEIARDIMLNEDSEYNADNEISYFTKLVNKYTDRIEEYRKYQLEKDFNKIKINDFNNFVIDLDNEIKNNNETINLDRNRKLAENLMYLKDILCVIFQKMK